MAGHWSEGYLGVPYHPEQCDCADFVARVRRERFGHAVTLPGRARGLRALNEQLEGAVHLYATPTEAPVDGDLVLLRLVGRPECIGRHAGVWCDVGGMGHVLHCTAAAGACRHPAAEMPLYGYQITGVYRWH